PTDQLPRSYWYLYLRLSISIIFKLFAMHLKNKMLLALIGIMVSFSVNAQVWTAEQLGFSGDGLTDLSIPLPGHTEGPLQEALNRIDVKVIWFANHTLSALTIDGVAKFLINGNISVPEGKVLKFEAGNRLTGTGTVEGGVIDASMQSWIFELPLMVKPVSTATGWFSVKWYGA